MPLVTEPGIIASRRASAVASSFLFVGGSVDRILPSTSARPGQASRGRASCGLLTAVSNPSFDVAPAPEHQPPVTDSAAVRR